MSLPLVEELVPAPDPWDVARRLAHLPHLLAFHAPRVSGAQRSCHAAKHAAADDARSMHQTHFPLRCADRFRRDALQIVAALPDDECVRSRAVHERWRPQDMRQQ